MLLVAFDSGLTALLLLLHGTIPITYRGATYHIPIHVWIPLEYPRNPPLAFVVPTKEMGVRKGREVEPGGRVTEEVVNEWWRTWEVRHVALPSVRDPTNLTSYSSLSDQDHRDAAQASDGDLLGLAPGLC
jgi:hypothetical protein